MKKKCHLVGVKLGRDTKKEALWTKKSYEKDGYKVKITKGRLLGTPVRYWVNLIGCKK